MKRMLWILAGVVIGGALFLKIDVNALRQDMGERVITLNVTGLSSDLLKSNKIWGVKRKHFIRYQREIDLGEITGSGTYTITVPGEIDYIEIVPIGVIDHSSRYVPAQRYYVLKKAPTVMEINFTQQFYLQLGGWVRSSGDKAYAIIGVPAEADPQPQEGWYNEGTSVTIKPKGGGLRLAWWEIKWKEKATEVVLYSTDNPLQLVMDRSIDIRAVLVDEWERLPAKDPDQQGIAINQLSDGQTVRLIINGQVIAATRYWQRETNSSNAILPIPRDQTVSGYLQVTAPDGETVVFESPVYLGWRLMLRFLADENIFPSTIKLIRSRGYDVLDIKEANFNMRLLNGNWSSTGYRWQQQS